MVHGDSVSEDQLRALLTWYSAVGPEVRSQRMRSEKQHDMRHAMTRRDDDVDDDVSDNNNCQRHNKLSSGGNEMRSSPPAASDHSGETPVARTPNRYAAAQL